MWSSQGEPYRGNLPTNLNPDLPQDLQYSTYSTLGTVYGSVRAPPLDAMHIMHIDIRLVKLIALGGESERQD